MQVSLTFPAGSTKSEIISAVLKLFDVGVAHADVASGTLQASDAPDVGTDTGTVETPNANAPTHDSEGVPHDIRIHSAGKTLTDAGKWRKLKNTPPQKVAEVMAELKAAGKIITPAGTAVAPASAPAPAPATPPATAGLPAIGAPAGLPALGQPAAPSPFANLVNFFAAHTNSATNPNGRLTEAYISDSLKAYGYVDAQGAGSVLALQDVDADKIAAIRAAFAQVLGLPVGS